MTTATVTFTRTDGHTVTFENVRVDTIGPSAENPGVIGVEFEDDDYDRLVHVPFVESWTIEYTFDSEPVPTFNSEDDGVLADWERELLAANDDEPYSYDCHICGKQGGH
jgi:hypothetical protein